MIRTTTGVGASGKNYVFVIPVCSELDLKEAAKSVGEKSIAMLKAKDLLPLTGYIHGGCSPIELATSEEFSTLIDALGIREIPADDVILKPQLLM